MFLLNPNLALDPRSNLPQRWGFLGPTSRPPCCDLWTGWFLERGTRGSRTASTSGPKWSAWRNRNRWSLSGLKSKKYRITMGPELLQRKLPLRVPTVALPSSDLSLSKSYEEGQRLVRGVVIFSWSNSVPHSNRIVTFDWLPTNHYRMNSLQ